MLTINKTKKVKDNFLIKYRIFATYVITEAIFQKIIEKAAKTKIKINENNKTYYHVSLFKNLKLKNYESAALYERVEKDEEFIYLTYEEVYKIYSINHYTLKNLVHNLGDNSKIKIKNKFTKAFHISLFESIPLRGVKSSTYYLEERSKLVENIPCKCGVYCIKYEDKIIYIGASKNMRQRVFSHFKELMTKTHFNKSLEKFFYESNFNHFKAEVLEFCSEKNKLSLEKLYIEKLKPLCNIRVNKNIDVYTLNKMKEANLKTIHFKNTITTDVEFKSIIEDKDKLIAELQEKLLEFNSKIN